MMNGWRFVQGVAVAGLASGMRAIIVDLFSGLTLKKMANYFALSWALGPIIAPGLALICLTIVAGKLTFIYLPFMVG